MLRPHIPQLTDSGWRTHHSKCESRRNHRITAPGALPSSRGGFSADHRRGAPLYKLRRYFNIFDLAYHWLRLMPYVRQCEVSGIQNASRGRAVMTATITVLA